MRFRISFTQCFISVFLIVVRYGREIWLLGKVESCTRLSKSLLIFCWPLTFVCLHSRVLILVHMCMIEVTEECLMRTDHFLAVLQKLSICLSVFSCSSALSTTFIRFCWVAIWKRWFLRRYAFVL